MRNLELTLACDATDRTQAVLNGAVRPDGLDLNAMPLSVLEIARRMLTHREFDAAELSMTAYMVTLDRPDPEFVAIPVFPSRFFRHGCVFVNEDAGIEGPEDLAGKRVGLHDYVTTTALWVRGMLADEYGVAPGDVGWLQGVEAGESRVETLGLDLPDDVRLDSIPADRTLSGMLEDGDLDALVAFEPPSSFPDGPVERLFPDYRTVEREYYERTGHFPIMHTVVVRRSVYDAHPWVAQELYKVFNEAKDRCLADIGNTMELRCAVPWLVPEIEATRELMGENYWPYGIDENRETLETMTRYAHEQGLTDGRLDVDDLFAPETAEAFKV